MTTISLAFSSLKNSTNSSTSNTPVLPPASKVYNISVNKIFTLILLLMYFLYFNWDMHIAYRNRDSAWYDWDLAHIAVENKDRLIYTIKKKKDNVKIKIENLDTYRYTSHKEVIAIFSYLFNKYSNMKKITLFWFFFNSNTYSPALAPPLLFLLPLSLLLAVSALHRSHKLSVFCPCWTFHTSVWWTWSRLKTRQKGAEESLQKLSAKVSDTVSYEDIHTLKA